MFLDPAQTLVGAGVWENVKVIMPLELDRVVDRPRLLDCSHGWPRGFPKENRAFSACVWMGGVM